MKKAIKESKRRADEEFGRRLSEKYKEDKRLYWKEVQDERERGVNVSNEKNEVKDVDGRILREKEAVKGRWMKYFEKLMNIKSEGEAIVMCMGMIGGGGEMHEQEKIKREEVMKTNGNLKNRMALGVDGITAEMLKYGGETVVEWMHKICGLAWEKGRVPRDWTKAIIIPVYEYKGKGSRNISIYMPGLHPP